MLIEYENMKDLCMKNCDSNEYHLEAVHVTPWDGPTTIKFEVRPLKTRIKREVLFKLVNVFTMIGVNWNLFMGLSVVSFIEFIFFWTCMLPRRFLIYCRKQAKKEDLKKAMLKKGLKYINNLKTFNLK